MKDYIKYIISTIVFFVIYVLFQYLFRKNIDWEITLISTVVYFIINTISNILFNKLNVFKGL